MPLTGDARNQMITAITLGTKPANQAEYVSVMQAGVGVSFTEQTSTSILKKTGHGLTTGMVVVLSTLTGGAGLSTEDRPYYVKTVNANEIELSLTAAFVAEVWTSTVTGVTVTPLTEIAVTARIKSEWGAVAKMSADDNKPHLIGVPACTVNYISYHSALTVGVLMGISKVTPEVFAAAGKYEVTDSKLDLLGVA